jgi:ADP-ribose pyrophosphatase YjhB (NUDIX family)
MSNVPERILQPRYCQLCGHHLVERYIDSEKRLRQQCESCGFVHYLNPRVVTAVIVSNRGRVLLQRRAIEPRAGYWTFPGGFLEIGESAEDGARRETLEEVGLDVEPSRLVGVYTRQQVGIVLVAYAGEAATDDAVVGDFESSEVRWFAADEIPWAHLAFETTEAALRDWLASNADQADDARRGTMRP